MKSPLIRPPQLEPQPEGWVTGGRPPLLLPGAPGLGEAKEALPPTCA